jgi:quercetin dioxygenase-like cupin family protein
MSSESKQATIMDAGKGRKLNVLGHVVNVMLASADTQGDCYIFEAITPAGGVVPPHVHEREDEYGYIVEGVYEFFLNGRTYEAKTGAVLHFPRCIPHGFRNIGPTPGKTIWISTPGANVDPFFDELGALPADAPPDMEKVVGIFAKYDMQVFPPPAL